MPPANHAFLALWNDVVPARIAEYDAWHTFEHVPERVGIPGFVAARRYVAAERTTDRYFTRYDLTGLEALDGAAYTDVVAHPTPWSRSMRPSLANFVRLPCLRRVRAAAGEGGALLTMQVDAGANAAAIDAVTQELAEAVTQGRIVAIDAGAVAAAAPFPLPNAAAGGAGAKAATVTHVLLIDALDRTALTAFAPELRQRVEASGIAVAAQAAYDLAFALAPCGGRDRPPRAPPREDLRRKWQP